MTQFKAFSDRLRENLLTLDEEIEVARKFAKPRQGSESQVTLQWAKTLRDLIELRNATLGQIKLHLLGRDLEFGLPDEPANYYNTDAELSFERDFERFIATPWKSSDLNRKCEECHKSDRDVSWRELDELGFEDEYMCDSCYHKLEAEQNEAKSENNSTEIKTESAKTDNQPENSLHEALGEIDLSSPEKCQELIERIKVLKSSGHISPGAASVMIGTVNNAIEVHKRLSQ